MKHNYPLSLLGLFRVLSSLSCPGSYKPLCFSGTKGMGPSQERPGLGLHFGRSLQSHLGAKSNLHSVCLAPEVLFVSILCTGFLFATALQLSTSPSDHLPGSCWRDFAAPRLCPSRGETGVSRERAEWPDLGCQMLHNRASGKESGTITVRDLGHLSESPCSSDWHGGEGEGGRVWPPVSSQSEQQQRAHHGWNESQGLISCTFKLCFSNFNVHKDHLRILLKCNFCQASVSQCLSVDL